VVTDHLPSLGEQRRWEIVRAAANLGIARMIVGSAASRDTAVAKWGRLTPPITVVPNGVPLPRVSRAARAPGAPLEILFVGRLEDQKNPAFALDVHAAMRRAGHSATLRMVGDGSLAASLRARAVDAGVEWLGFVDDPTPLLARADLLLLPSAFESGLPLAAIEALGAGVPVLASDIAVHRGAGASRGGLQLLPVGDAARWGEAALAMARGSADLAGDARAIAERFGAEAMARQTLEVYERAARPSR
jgi:glycosyltransferase involved in cell wall biosynthesis